jgi:hypothetical protein
LSRIFLPCRLCFGGGFVPRPREVTEALWNACCAAVVATGLTGTVHRSDRCSTGNNSCKFPLCVLVCFGSKGCLLVPRSSSTSVAARIWPTWVVCRRRELEAVFVLLESLSPSRRIFIGSHSLPPFLVRRIGSSPHVKAKKMTKPKNKPTSKPWMVQKWDPQDCNARKER